MGENIILFDIGNTNTKIGICNGQTPMRSYVVPSVEQQTADQFGLSLMSIMRHEGIDAGSVKEFIGSSVVPGMSSLIDKACFRFFGKKLLFAPEDIPIPLENRYARKHEVGADRLVGAFAARRMFPEASSIISVDFGTATTFDCVQGNSYVGGLICPGVSSSASALSSRTAKLPQISLEIEDKKLLPCSSTATSLNQGFVFGFAAMTEGLVARLKEHLCGEVFVVGTGGFATPLSCVTDCFDAVRPDMLLEGLRILYEEFSATCE